MLTILQRSVHSIFDLYHQEDRGYLNFSFLFLVLSGLAAVFFTLLVLLLASTFYRLGEFGEYYSFFQLVQLPQVWFELKLCLLYFTTASIGLYAIYLGQVLKTLGVQLSLKGFFASTKEGDWTRYLIVMAVLVLFYSLTFVDVFEIEMLESESLRNLFGSPEDPEEDFRLNKFYIWCNSLVRLAGEFLPCIAAYFIVVWKEYPIMNSSIFKKFSRYIWVALIISFCLTSIANTAVAYTSQYLLGLLGVPFRAEIAQSTFSLLVSMIIAAYFYTGAAGAVLFPVQEIREAEKEVEAKNEALENKNSSTENITL